MLMRALRWSSHDHIVGAVTAIGIRGVYSIQKVGPCWSLQGVGHDDLPLLALPPEGKVFVYLQVAQDYAAAVDAKMLAESQVGGE